MKEREYAWYVEANGHTNEIIAGELPGENALKNILTSEGTKNLWRCTFPFIRWLMKNKSYAALDFAIFSQRLPGGKIHPCKFFQSVKTKRARRIKRQIAKIQARRAAHS